MRIPNTKRYELSAKFLLESLFEYNLEKSESPDLVDQKQDVGIEVTRAVSPKEAEMMRFSEEIDPHKNISSIAPEKIARFKKLGGDIKEYDNMKYISYGSNLISEDRLVEAIKRKQEKLNSNRFTVYKSNQLFLYSDRLPINKQHIKSIITKPQINLLPIQFDWIYIFDFISLWKFSITPPFTIERKKIDQKTQYKVNEYLYK